MWVEVLYWIDHVWASKECACCVCDPSVHSVPRFCVCFCMPEVISLFKGLSAGSQVFALLMFFSLSDFAYYVVG